MKKVVILLLCLGSIALTGCATTIEGNNQNWYYAVAAPEHYKVWVEHLELEKPGERHWRMPMGNVECCWKGPKGPFGSGGRLSPFPNLIGIQWFSFAEQKFYQRLIILPEDLQEKMSVEATYQTSMGTFKGPRNSLIIGVAPGGTIVLWIMNQIGNEIEVARMQANEIEGDPTQYQKRTKSYLDEHGSYLEKHGIPTEGW
ncbi:hypothetical protein RE428_05740 [Marinobacter nanhaiticus D15-8W]|uniref:DUF2931 family protein n=1 Tax=Marinobacter nanhaiticus D15-8W TaxID=626887 RepID=N6WTE3_9GAMM|nr:DUF2931 family protein [Marinobacter nanhaiticus]ENO14756.1 DUF2931 family protein [Marinobacter nanhaiticus D15-8W]BES69556.1 hypothetical protein RE428_05740 [Marinobacter nanhaiticus D15-8W]